MSRLALLSTLLTALAVSSTPARANAFLFTPASSGVSYSVNDGGFFVSSSPITGPFASAGFAGSNFQLSAIGPSYSDSGIVLYFLGGLKLGDLLSVSVATDNPSAMNINLWVDTSGDGQFFAFTGTHYDGLNGDSYGSYGSYGNTTLLTGASTRAFFTPPASGYTTLAALQAAYPNAAVAIWAGITNAGGHADISGITVTDNSPAPEPASMVLLGGGLIGIGVLLKRKRAAD